MEIARYSGEILSERVAFAKKHTKTYRDYRAKDESRKFADLIDRARTVGIEASSFISAADLEKAVLEEELHLTLQKRQEEAEQRDDVVED